MNLFMVELSVSDWPRLLTWYRDVVGLQEVVCVPGDGFALLAAGSAGVALKRSAESPVEDTARCRLVFEVADLDADLARLAAAGVAFEGPPKASPEGYRIVHFRDPEDNPLSLFEWIKEARSASR